MTDPDQLSADLLNEIIARYRDAARLLRRTITDPPGGTDSSQEWNQTRASQALSQIADEFRRLQSAASAWTGRALTNAIQSGVARGAKQIQAAGLDLSDRIAEALQSGQRMLAKPEAAWNLVDRSTVEILARDTIGDFTKAINGMQSNAVRALRGMAASGVTNAQVNQLVTRGVILGNPNLASAELRDALQKIHGREVTVPTKNGGQMDFPVDYYAKLVVNSKTREATMAGRHAVLEEMDVDLVIIHGRDSTNPCTTAVGKVFSISGRSDRFPALDWAIRSFKLFHPNCSKTTAPFIAELATPAKLESVAPDRYMDEVASANTVTEKMRVLRENRGTAVRRIQQQSSIEDIRARARATGYEPPRHGFAA